MRPSGLLPEKRCFDSRLADSLVGVFASNLRLIDGSLHLQNSFALAIKSDGDTSTERIVLRDYSVILAARR
jgi:hypothetical protein